MRPFLATYEIVNFNNFSERRSAPVLSSCGREAAQTLASLCGFVLRKRACVLFFGMFAYRQSGICEAADAAQRREIYSFCGIFVTKA